jgi:solute carrier family 36 (proton-coupled amino acid transporter)
MTSPTRPVNIVSPRISPAAAGFGTPGSRRGTGSPAAVGTPYSGTGTPDLRSLRAQYFGTPPLPNIPPRTGTSTPRGGPSTSTDPLGFPRGGTPRPVPSISGISARRPAVIGLGIDDILQPDPTADVESTYEEDKVKVLRKHLVSREERQGNNNGSSGVPSRKSSIANLAFEAQEDSEAFPVPYHTPGADITYVGVIRIWYSTFHSEVAAPFLGTVYTSGSKIRVDNCVHAQHRFRALQG